MKTDLALTKSFEAAASQIYAKAAAVLDAIAKKTPPFEHPCLAVGAVSVPISLRADHHPHRLESELTIESAGAPAAFPRFAGVLSVTPLREYGCEIWLQGSYEPPLGSAGEAIDLTILRGAAEKSLATWFASLADAISAR